MKIFLVGCSLCLSLLSSAQGTFQKLYTTSIVDGDARYLVQSSDNGFIFSIGSNITGINIMKTDSNGFVEWVYAFPYACEGFNVIETHDNNFIVSGFRNENSGYRLAPFMLKLNSGGNLLWSRGYNLQNLQASGTISAVVESDDSGLVLMSALPLSGNGSYDIIVIKTDSSGNLIWSRNYGGSNNEFGYTIIKARPSGYIIFGATDNFGPFSKLIYKIDNSGVVQWARLAGASPVIESREPIRQTNDNGYVLFGEGINNKNISKIDSNGNFLWAKSFSSFFSLYMTSLLQTSDGGIAVSGTMTDTTNDSHAFIAKLDSMGIPQWTSYYNDSLSCSSGAFTLTQTSDGGFAFTGFHYCTTTPTSICLVKTDSSGKLICPGYNIPGFQFSVINNPDSLISLNAGSFLLPDSTVSSNFNNFSYSESSFCFTPVITSIREPFSATITFSPNPFHSTATLKGNALPTTIGITMYDAHLKIYNSMGALVRTEKILNPSSYIFERNDLPAGLYFYILQTRNSELPAPGSGLTSSGKFVIE